MNIDKILQPDPTVQPPGRSAFQKYVRNDYPSVPWQLSWPNTFLSYNGQNTPKLEEKPVGFARFEGEQPLGSCLSHARHHGPKMASRKSQGERRPRTTFSAEQTATLEEEYSNSEYISRSKRLRLAETLVLNEGQIKIWFQNRRAKDKRIEKAQMDNRLRYLTALSMKNIGTGGYMGENSEEAIEKPDSTSPQPPSTVEQ